MQETRPVNQDGSKTVRQGGREKVRKAAEGAGRVLSVLQRYPRTRKGLWLNEKGEPSIRITAMALLVLAKEGNTIIFGPSKQEVRQGVGALNHRMVMVMMDRLWSGKQDEERSLDAIGEDVLQAMVLVVHARMAPGSPMLPIQSCSAVSTALKPGRLEQAFPEQGIGLPRNDEVRLLFVLLQKQIQLYRSSNPRKATMPDPIDVAGIKRMKVWGARCLKDTNADAERLLTLLLDSLLLDSPKKSPPVATQAGFLWKRIHRIMQADQKKSGKDLPARLLFLDTLLRTEFLVDALPKELRESRSKRLEAWEERLKGRVTKAKGLSSDDLYHLMTLAQLRGPVKIWR